MHALSCSENLFVWNRLSFPCLCDMVMGLVDLPLCQTLYYPLEFCMAKIVSKYEQNLMFGLTRLGIIVHLD